MASQHRSIGFVLISLALAFTVAATGLEAAEASAFPVYNVTDFGAVGDGTALNTAAIQKAIDTATAAGGGVVYFPPGKFISGSLDIKDNVTLHIEAGATIFGSPNREDYPLGHLIYAEDAKNIAIRGRGAIDGNGYAFWRKDYGKRVGTKWESSETPTDNFRWMPGEWRPSRMLTFLRCENLLLEDITLQNSPGWTVHPMDCHIVNIRGVSLINGIYDKDGPNTDGINPDGCSVVRISDSYLQCGDDCIVLKITNRPGGNKVCRDITVTNCVLTTTETALKIGSESYGEFRNITFSNCVIHDSGAGIGLWMRDGGLIDGWLMDNISIDLTRLKNGGQPIYLWSYRREDDTPWGTVRNVTISNVTAKGDGGMFISGVKERHIEGLTLENIRIHMRGERNTPWHADPPYPYTVWGHHRAPFDIFIRYVDDLKLKDVQFTWSTPENPMWGHAIRAHDVNNLELDGFIGRQAAGSGVAAVWLKNVKGVHITNCRPPEGTGTFLQLVAGTEHVNLIGNDFSKVKKIMSLDGVDAKEVFQAGNRMPGK